MKKPTSIQKKIIDFEGNTVVTASPGSGKTYCLVEKIRVTIPELLAYEGVIAITFTNKASREIKNRLKGEKCDNLFIGTLDSFYFSEIILPFTHYITRKREKIEIIETEKNDEIEKLLFSNEIPLKRLAEISLYILKNVPQSRLYLKSKYKLILIDEYQDCSDIQHEIFKFIVDMGIIGFCVGDINQSIYKFAEKSSKYLEAIVSDEKFKHFELIENKRSHKSITDYSSRVLNKNYLTTIDKDIRVKKVNVNGDERHSIKGIEKILEKVKETYDIQHNNQIAVLCRSNQAVSRLSSFFEIPNKVYLENPLKKLKLRTLIMINLTVLFEGFFEFKLEQTTITEFCDSIYNLSEKDMRCLKQIITDIFNSEQIIECMNLINSYLFYCGDLKLNSGEYLELINFLKEINDLSFFRPAQNNEIQIMNFHKSKGLEFDAVFIFDNHRYIFPFEFDNKFSDFEEDLRLHYVSISRASKICYLMQGNKRFSYRQKKIINANDSHFLGINELARFRDPIFWNNIQI